jgi:hypothetical protein
LSPRSIPKIRRYSMLSPENLCGCLAA